MRLLPVFLFVSVAVSVASGAACDLAPRVTTDPAREQWSAIAPQNKQRISALRSRLTVVGGRVASLTVPPGVQDPLLSQQISDLQGQVSQLEPTIAGFEQAVATIGGEIESALSRRDKVNARRLVDLAGPRLDEAFASAGKPFDAIELRLPEAEAGTSRHLATVAAEEQRLVRIASEGGTVDMVMKFNGNALDLADPATKAGFDRVVKLGTACDALRLTVVSLEAARADDLKQKLVGAGVPADHVAGSADPQKQIAAELVRVTVTAPCLPTVPTAAGGPPPPAGAGTPSPLLPSPPVVERVPAPGHAGHAH